MVRSAWGAPSHNPASRFLDELPDDLVDWRRTEADQIPVARPDLTAYDGPRRADRRRPPQLHLRPPAADAAAKSKPARESRPSSPATGSLHDSFGMGTVVASRASATSRSPRSTSASEGVKRLLLRYAPVEKL